jgi:hypothetical protein
MSVNENDDHVVQATGPMRRAHQPGLQTGFGAQRSLKMLLQA